MKKLIPLTILFLSTLSNTGIVFAQGTLTPSTSNTSVDPMIVVPMLLTMFALFLIFYAIFCIPIQILAQKTQTPNAWLAWVPFANLYLLCKIAQKPGWWMLLMLVPFVQIIFFILAWMGISYVRNRPTWLGILIIIPVVNIVLIWYLALSDENTTTAMPSAS